MKQTQIISGKFGKLVEVVKDNQQAIEALEYIYDLNKSGSNRIVIPYLMYKAIDLHNQYSQHMAIPKSRKSPSSKPVTMKQFQQSAKIYSPKGKSNPKMLKKTSTYDELYYRRTLLMNEDGREREGIYLHTVSLTRSFIQEEEGTRIFSPVHPQPIPVDILDAREPEVLEMVTQLLEETPTAAHSPHYQP